MAQTPDDDQRLRHYLLGALPRYQHKQIEKRFFEDDALFGRLLSTEERLIADYARGILAGQERLRFERYFLSTPQRRQRLREFAETAAAETAPISPAPPQVADSPARHRGLLPRLRALWRLVRGSRAMLQIAFAVLVVGLALGLWAVAIKLRQGTRSEQRLSAQLPEPSPPPSPVTQTTPEWVSVNAAPLPNATGSPTPFPTPKEKGSDRRHASPGGGATNPSGPTVIATLTPGLLRGDSQMPTVRVTPGTPTITIRVSLTDDKYGFYDATLLNEERREVWRWRMIKPQGAGATLSFALPTRRAVEGFYYLILYGVDAKDKEAKLDTYPFEVERH